MIKMICSIKDLAAEELEEAIMNKFHKRLPNEVPEELNEAVLLAGISMLNCQQMEINQVMLKSW